MGKESPGTVVFDAGALIALERADPYIGRLLELADTVHIPAGVLAQVWRDPRRQARLSRLVSTEGTEIHALDEEQARAAGTLLALTRTSDVVDATVVLVTRSVGGVAITSDPDDLRTLDPALPMMSC